MRNAPENFSIRDYHDMLLIYGEARTSSVKARRLYRERFPRRRCPAQTTFPATSQRLLDTGSVVVNKQCSGRSFTRRVLDAEEQILERFNENPNLSMRQLSREFGVSPSIVLRAISEQQYHERETDSEVDGGVDSESDEESDNESEKSEPIVNVVTKLKPMYEGQDGVYCRLCLERVDKKTVTPLGEIDFNYPRKSDAFKKKKLEEAQEIHEMLKLCLPFFNALIFNPSICSACLAKLKISYEFATECQNNQRLIEKYADINCTTTTERVVDINKMIETKFALSDDANPSDKETKVPIPNGVSKNKISSTQQMRLVRTKRLRLSEDSPASKKQKICHNSQDENSPTSSNATTELYEDDSSSASQQEVAFDIQQREIIDATDIKNKIPVKIETNHIDSPDFIELDDLTIKQEEHEKLITGNDIDKQHLHSHGRENVPLDKKYMPSFDGEPVITNINSHLEVSTLDVIK